jgi:hypothetical protein
LKTGRDRFDHALFFCRFALGSGCAAAGKSFATV